MRRMRLFLMACVFTCTFFILFAGDNRTIFSTQSWGVIRLTYELTVNPNIIGVFQGSTWEYAIEGIPENVTWRTTTSDAAIATVSPSEGQGSEGEISIQGEGGGTCSIRFEITSGPHEGEFVTIDVNVANE